MDVQLINPFVIAVQRVFETMVHTKATVGTPTLRMEANPVHDVSGVIGFSGDAVGCVVLSFPMDVACRVATAFAGTEIDQNHPDFTDAIGELANMVAGNAKTEFSGMKISVSLPSVITGKGHTVAHPTQIPRIVIPCETDLGSVFIEIGLTLKNVSTPITTETQGASV